MKINHSWLAPGQPSERSISARAVTAVIPNAQGLTRNSVVKTGVLDRESLSITTRITQGRRNLCQRHLNPQTIRASRTIEMPYSLYSPDGNTRQMTGLLGSCAHVVGQYRQKRLWLKF